MVSPPVIHSRTSFDLSMSQRYTCTQNCVVGDIVLGIETISGEFSFSSWVHTLNPRLVLELMVVPCLVPVLVSWLVLVRGGPGRSHRSDFGFALVFQLYDHGLRQPRAPAAGTPTGCIQLYTRQHTDE